MAVAEPLKPKTNDSENRERTKRLLEFLKYHAKMKILCIFDDFSSTKVWLLIEILSEKIRIVVCQKTDFKKRDKWKIMIFFKILDSQACDARLLHRRTLVEVEGSTLRPILKN